MKITKRQLRRIIKEEKRKLLREQFTRGTFNVSIETVSPGATLDPEEIFFHLQDVLDQWALENREVFGPLDIQVDLDYSP